MVVNRDFGVRSLRREFGISVELDEGTVPTAKSADGHASTWLYLGPEPEGFPGRAFMPLRYHFAILGVLRDKSLDHLAFAFGTFHWFMGDGGE